MTSSEVEFAFKRLVCDQIELAPDGENKFIVHTPFKFDDGDHFVIVLKNLGGGWTITDEGHTLMHLSYTGFTITPPRAALIEQALMAAAMEDREGELILSVPRDDFGEALFTFTQAITRVAEVAKWTRAHVRSTFIDDFKDLLSALLPASRLKFNYFDQAHDPDGRYPVDCKVNGMPRPLYIFAIGGDMRCKDATITIHQLRDWDSNFESMAIFEDQSQISRNTLARFSDVIGKQFSSMGVRQEIGEYLRQHVSGLLSEPKPDTSVN